MASIANETRIDLVGFRKAVATYEQLLDFDVADPDFDGSFERNVLEAVSGLYSAGRAMASGGAGSAPAEADESDGWFESWRWSYDRAGTFLGHSPLADELSFIFADVRAGARHYDAGRLSEAEVEWGSRFAVWGDHATETIRELRRLVEGHGIDPDALRLFIAEVAPVVHSGHGCEHCDCGCHSHQAAGVSGTGSAGAAA